MERVDGDVPSADRPSFMEAGWLFDATPEKQRQFYDDCVTALTRLHQIDPAKAGLFHLGRKGRRSTHLGRELSWLQGLYKWGRGAAPQPIIERAFEDAWATMPGMTDGALLWGDARPANTIVRNFRIAALLDWELATLGPPELDLFWFLEMNRMRARGRPLPGFRSDEETIVFYEQARAVKIRSAGFFRYFSVLKMAVLMLRHLQVKVAMGDLAKDHPILTDNTSLRRLAELRGTSKAVAC
jgi:aminoglycoside phosphotransferase (APT) family kinase protein